MSHKLTYSSFEIIHYDVTATQNTDHIDDIGKPERKQND
jgi:hypothetical protein